MHLFIFLVSLDDNRDSFLLFGNICYSINIFNFLQSWLNHKRNLMNHKNSKNKANTKLYRKKWERKSGVICNFTTNKIVAFELWRQRVIPDVSMVHSRKSDFSIKFTDSSFNFGKTKQILVLSENKLHFAKLLSLANSDSGIKSDEWVTPEGVSGLSKETALVIYLAFSAKVANLYYIILTAFKTYWPDTVAKFISGTQETFI